jgi:oxygen-independent coproporphyrinogen III oxidase
MESLYIHFPYCEVKCPYCDFYSLPSTHPLVQEEDRYLEALLKEWDFYPCPPLKTVFWGGGTPSFSKPKTLLRLAERLQPLLTNQTEWTMEVNPASAVGQMEVLQTLKTMGLNRISMGVQSLDPHLLKVLGRAHTRETALETLATLFDLGFQDISVDLLFGVPTQSVQQLKETLDTLLTFPIRHISCYLLTLHPSHWMTKQLPSEVEQVLQFEWVRQSLLQAGFTGYEVSNFCREERVCQHNLRIWQGASYLGLGPSAHSFDGQKRWRNKSGLKAYWTDLEQGQLPIQEEESLTKAQLALERWLFQARLREGFPRKWLKSETQKKQAEQLLLSKHLETAGPLRLRISHLGLLLSDQIIKSLC